MFSADSKFISGSKGTAAGGAYFWGMAYRDFTMERLRAEFDVECLGAPLFAAAKSVAPSAWLLETLVLGHRSGLGTDKARSERLVSPVLAELARRNHHELAVVSGASLDAAPARGLVGICDFALSFIKIQDFIEAPVCCLVGARTREDDNGVAECAAQLVGASLRDAPDQRAGSPRYGCVTTGVEWRFMQLEKQLLTFDTGYYLINDLPPLLGALQHIIDRTKPPG
jgi:hypothetical protein